MSQSNFQLHRSLGGGSSIFGLPLLGILELLMFLKYALQEDSLKKKTFHCALFLVGL